MKKLISLLTVLIVLVSCMVTAHAHESFMLYYATQEPEESLEANIAYYFADRVLEYTDHGLAVDVYFDGSLGTPEESLKQLQGSKDDSAVTVDFMLIPVSELQGIGAGELSLAALPATFSSHEAFQAFAAGDTAKGYLEFPKNNKQKMICLGFVELGYLQTVLTAPVDSVAGLQGLRYAYDGSLLMDEALTAIGAVPADMPENCAAALSDGSVNAAEKTLFTYQTECLQESTPVILLDNHRMDVYMLAMSADTWRMLTGLERRCLQLSVQDTVAYDVGLVSHMEAAQLEALRGQGVQIIEPADSWSDWTESLNAAYAEPLSELYGAMHK